MRRIAAIVLLTAACQNAERARTASAPQVPTQPADSHQQEVLNWQKTRSERLKTEDGWLSLVGLHWMEPGPHRLGSDSRSDIVLPASVPPVAGTITLRDGNATLEPATEMTIADKPVAGRVELLDDTEENGPTIVRIGSVRFQVIKRGDRFALRVKDADAETRTKFKGLEYFPIDPKWRVEARLESYHPPKTVPIADITGMVADNVSPGALVFKVDGNEYRLDPILEDDRYFIIFKDETSKDSTYEAGRYLYAERPGPDGKVIVDFNRAYNPPCVFTPYATCPLPPPQNRLPVRVEAGEKRYAH